MPLGNDVLEREEKWGEIIKQGKVLGLWGAWSYRNGRPRALPQKSPPDNRPRSENYFIVSLPGYLIVLK